MLKYFNKTCRYVLFIALITLCGCRLKYNETSLREDLQHSQAGIELFTNFQALQENNSSAMLAGEMISIQVHNFKSKNHKRTFRKISKDFADKGELIAINEESFSFPNRIWLRKLIINDTLFQYNIIYALANADDNIKVVVANYYFEEHFLKVDSIARYILHHDIPPEIFTDLSAANVDFIGRDLNLDPICNWESVYVLSCADKGKIRWSIHQNIKEAERAKNIHLAFAKSYQYSELLEEKTMNVIFEGEEVKAHRLVFGLKGSGLLSQRNHKMIVYFLATEVRGNFVHAVLSFYEEQSAPGRLPSLIKEVMSLPE